MNQRMIDGAINYARADKSDPFALRRAMAHLRSGIATFANGQGQEAFYSAEEYTETKSYTDGQGRNVEYHVPAYRNRVRP